MAHMATKPSCTVPHFFLPPAAPSSLRSHEITLPSMTTPLPSMKATRERPSQFLKVSHTSGCCGWKLHCAISFDFSECGSSIFLPPVSLNPWCLLLSGLLPHLPLEFADAAGRAAAAHE